MGDAGAFVPPALYVPERGVGRQGAEHAYESDNTYVGLVGSWALCTGVSV